VSAAALGASAGGPVNELIFAFNPAGRLISVDVLRAGLSPADAAAVFTKQTGALRAALGTAPVQVGDPSPGYLGSGRSRTVLASYRYADYLASVTAMAMPSGVSVRAQYQSATHVQ
jgi:hypothetical protein